MWTRALLKNNAKNVIKRRGWIMVLAAAVYTIVSGLAVTVNTSETITEMIDGGDVLNSVVADTTKVLSVGGLLNIPLTNTTFAGMASMICGLCALLVVPVLQVGYSRFLMESRQGEAPFDTLASAFRGGSFGKVWVTQLLTGLKIFLWSLLLFVPGVMKYYEYSQVSYLLAENPWLTASRAQEISRKMTDGEKWNIFVLDLSFIGWTLLAGVVAAAVSGILGMVGLGWLGIGAVAQIAVSAYMNSTKAELYAALRAKVDAAGILQPGELAGFVTH